MNTSVWAAIVMLVVVGCVVAFVLIKKSASSRKAWLPEEQKKDQHRLEASALVHDAHTWFVSAKQEKDPIKALVKSSFGLVLLRAVQAVVKLEEINGVHLPGTVNGPEQLLIELTKQHAGFEQAAASPEPKADLLTAVSKTPEHSQQASPTKSFFTPVSVSGTRRGVVGNRNQL
jgi:hypothetical protein